MGFFNQKTKSHLNTYSIIITIKKYSLIMNIIVCIVLRFEGSKKKCHWKDEDDDDDDDSKDVKDTHMELVQYV